MTKKLKKNKKGANNFNKYFLLLSTGNSSKDGTELITEFYNIGPLSQGISSLAGLILLYGVTGYYYNKGLSDKGGGLDGNTRIGLIISDLTINLVLGLYYIDHRETAMGAMMVKCPVAVSPLIFILELICFYMYYRFVKGSNTKKNTGKRASK